MAMRGVCERAGRSAEYAASGISFVANEPGTYWHICPPPEHAEKGMYGKLVVC